MGSRPHKWPGDVVRGRMVARLVPIRLSAHDIFLRRSTRC